MAYQTTFKKSAKKILLTAGIVLPLAALSLVIVNVNERKTIKSEASSVHCCKLKWTKEFYFTTTIPCNQADQADEVDMSNCQAVRCCWADFDGSGTRTYRWVKASECVGQIALNSNCPASGGACLCGGSSGIKAYINYGAEDYRPGKIVVTDGKLKIGQSYLISFIPQSICGRPKIGQFRINSTVSSSWCKDTKVGRKTFKRRLTDNGWCEVYNTMQLYAGDNRGEFYVPFTVPEGITTLDVQGRFHCPCGGVWTDVCQNSFAVVQP